MNTTIAVTPVAAVWTPPPPLPHLLDIFIEDLHKCGLTGEDRAAKLLYLALTSRVFERPVSVAIKGPSSAGKSFTVDSVLKFFPPSAHCKFTGMSQKALVYWDEPIKHRFLVVYEAHGITGKLGAYFVRSLLSEGRLEWSVVERGEGGEQRTVKYEKEGPTGLITTTTLADLHPENETRMLSIPINDTAEQTRDVMVSIAEGKTPVDFVRWHKIQNALYCAPAVVVPFAVRLAEPIEPAAIRMRRDFTLLLNLIKAHALLRPYAQRHERGAVIASIEDYAAVRELVADLFVDAAASEVSDVMRETVQAVAVLLQERTEVNIVQLAAHLGRHKSVVCRRVQEAIRGGYLANLEPSSGRPARLVLGKPLPESVQVLPETL